MISSDGLCEDMETINAQIIMNRIEDNDVNWIYHHFSDDFQEVSSFDELTKLLEEYNRIRTTNTQYKHIHINHQDEYIWFDSKMTSGVSVTLNKYQEIISLVLIPLRHIHVSKNTKQTYTLPIVQDWLVWSGGDNVLLNTHYHYKHQRHALDLIRVEQGMTYKGNPQLCENYYAYNKPILAPANGIVVEIVDGIADGVPGEINTNHPEGNYIIIKHNIHEYSMIAHIKPNSFKIEKGDELLRGQHIANVGNSGNSSEPHVHFQVMDSNDLQMAQTLKIKLHNYASPVKGDIVTYTGDNILVNKDNYFSAFIKSISTNITQIFRN